MSFWTRIVIMTFAFYAAADLLNTHWYVASLEAYVALTCLRYGEW